jgi:hypothetical protein
VERDV